MVGIYYNYLSLVVLMMRRRPPVPTCTDTLFPYATRFRSTAEGCCMAQTVMMIPMMMVPVNQPKPHCTETVEYGYEDVPVRPARRTIPKRTKIAPDKRVKLQPVK